jgi:catechol 2,3-dioxygenase
MTLACVRALRSVEIGLADPQAALRFFTAVWNLGYVGEIDGAHYLRATGGFHHVLAIRRAGAPCMHRMVFDAADRATVDALHRQLAAHGLKTVEAPALLRQPHGAYGFGFKDPEGRNTAVVCGVEDHPDAADKADRPRKLSHVNVNAGDSEATFLCYRDALGFRLTDTTQRLRFLSCNADHHSMVLSFAGGPTLNHIAFEAPDLESVMRGAGRMREDGRGIEWGPGRHGPGNNVFCYFLGPEEFPLELTAEMQQVDEGHRAGTPDDWKWPSGRLDHWGISAGPSERMEEAGLRIHFAADGWRLDDWR